jgi:protein involved in polysaccharide export with SLBB domain
MSHLCTRVHTFITSPSRRKRISHLKAYGVWVLLVLLGTGCSQRNEVLAATHGSDGLALATNVTGAPSSPRLGANDFIVVTMYGSTLTGSFSSRQLITIDPDGSVTLPDFPKIAAEGLTGDQLGERIRQLAMIRKSVVLPGDADGPPNVQVTVVFSAADAPADPTLPKLSKGDTVDVEIFELVTPGVTWSEPITIDANGDMTVPHVGTLRAAGLTPEQLVAKISYLVVDRRKPMNRPPPPPEIKVTRRAATAPAAATKPSR